jgi:hypothetical protein
MSAQSVRPSPSSSLPSLHLFSIGVPPLHEQPVSLLPHVDLALQLVEFELGEHPWQVFDGLTVPEPTTWPLMQQLLDGLKQLPLHSPN